MHRAQILLEEWQYRHLQKLAKQNKKSLSQIIRDWINEKLKKAGRGKDPLKEAVGLLKGKIQKSTDSKKIDDYLYDKDW